MMFIRAPAAKSVVFVSYAIILLLSIFATTYFIPVFATDGINGTGEATVSPGNIAATLKPGESVTENKTVIITRLPSGPVDVFFIFDLTASMGGVLSTAKARSLEIMDNISAITGDAAFGVGSLQDYPGIFDSCGYVARYGMDSDYPWSLDRDITPDKNAVNVVINSLGLGDGNDGPESYARALYESQFVAWRNGSKKIVIIFEDNIPHDCNMAAYGCGGSTGVDPGRDALTGTADDLAWADVIAQLKAAGIEVIIADSGGAFSCDGPWLYAMNETGGAFVSIDSTDEIPEKVIASVENLSGRVDVTLMPQAGFEAWVNWTPDSYSGVGINATLYFAVNITVPNGTMPGVYSFVIKIVGGNVTLANQTVLINVTEKAAQKPVLISEIYYETPDDVNNEFIELTVRDEAGTGDINISGWYITTLDGDKHVLPDVVGLGNFDYVAIRTGPGISDLDATDGSTTIYLSLVSEVLDNTGDEVALFDADDNLIDFVRYKGGNGDPVLGGWSSGDAGPVADNIAKSVQIHGSDLNSSDNWVSASPSIAEPNHFEWIINEADGLLYQIHNGRNFPEIPDGPRTEVQFDIHNVSAAMNLSDVQQVVEMLNFTYNFLRSEGFNKTPITGADGDVDIEVTMAGPGQNAGFGDANQGTKLRVTLFPFTSFNNSVRNKLVLEHEHTHLFQYSQSGGWGPTSDWGDIEGHAEYWSFKITKSEFNITTDQIVDIDYRTKPPSLWLQNTDLPNNPFTDFQVSWPHYWANHLLYRYIAETYGQEKVAHMHKVRNVSAGITGIKTIDKAFKEQGKNTTFVDIHSGYTIWLYNNFKDMITLTKNETFNGGIITESETLNPWGTDYEKININKTKINGSGPYNISFSGQPGVNYSMAVLVKNNSGYALAGTIMFQGKGSILINTNSSEIVVIKTQINNESVGRTNYTINFTVPEAADTQPPVITKTVHGPQSGTCPPKNATDKCFIRANRTSIIVNATDPQPNPGGNVTCSLTVAGPDSKNLSGAPPFNITIRRDSEHNLTVVCRDALNNTAIDKETFFVDSTAPTCRLNLTRWPPFATFTFEDKKAGITSITPKIVKGANLTPPVPLNFSPPTNSPVVIAVARTNATVSVTLIATDAVGNAISCDPVAATIVRNKGRPETYVFANIPQEEGIVTVTNGNPGIASLLVTVNGRRFNIPRLRNNEVRSIYVAFAMIPGDNNIFTFTPRGRVGSSAEIMIWDGGGIVTPPTTHYNPNIFNTLYNINAGTMPSSGATHTGASTVVNDNIKRSLQYPTSG